jgi:hypothetical protein
MPHYCAVVALLNLTPYVGVGFDRLSQVVVGALGCPNMPDAPLTDADGTNAAKSNIGTPGYGVCFCAIRGAGAFAGSLTDDGAPQNVRHIGTTYPIVTTADPFPAPPRRSSPFTIIENALLKYMQDSIPFRLYHVQRIFIQDSADFSKMRFMESYESRHSAHGVTGALVRCISSPPLL